MMDVEETNTASTASSSPRPSSPAADSTFIREEERKRERNNSCNFGGFGFGDPHAKTALPPSRRKIQFLVQRWKLEIELVPNLYGAHMRTRAPPPESAESESGRLFRSRIDDDGGGGGGGGTHGLRVCDERDITVVGRRKYTGPRIRGIGVYTRGRRLIMHALSAPPPPALSVPQRPLVRALLLHSVDLKMQVTSKTRVSVSYVGPRRNSGKANFKAEEIQFGPRRSRISRLDHRVFYASNPADAWKRFFVCNNAEKQTREFIEITGSFRPPLFDPYDNFSIEKKLRVVSIKAIIIDDTRNSGDENGVTDTVSVILSLMVSNNPATWEREERTYRRAQQPFGGYQSRFHPTQQQRVAYQANVMSKIAAQSTTSHDRDVFIDEKLYLAELSRESVIGRVRRAAGEKRERERMSTAASPRWDEVPAVAGVGSIQKRQQSAPPYYVFSSDPYPSCSSPRCFSSRESSPPPLPATAPLPRCAPPASLPPTGSIAPERFTASRKISTTGNNSYPSHCFLPRTLLSSTSVENPKRIPKTKILVFRSPVDGALMGNWLPGENFWSPREIIRLIAN
ncbi:hypothetical protein DBV15_08452 [Temnothorax longispinosus]|uniref:Uncharacterized protein n=1 Tax=Temnothorax longispinosus TaxID=300112 RepID=A0A4S2L8N8_9HYME|nr:hypothetical protein DBV15_08452 [Temnothorax longispinosus]